MPPSCLTSESPVLFRLAIPAGCKLLRYAHTPVSALSDLLEVISSRRVWVQVANPLRPDRELSSESREVVDVVRLCFFALPVPLPVPPAVVCLRGLCRRMRRPILGRAWGFVRLPDGRQGLFCVLIFTRSTCRYVCTRARFRNLKPKTKDINTYEKGGQLKGASSVVPKIVKSLTFRLAALHCLGNIGSGGPALDSIRPAPSGPCPLSCDFPRGQLPVAWKGLSLACDVSVPSRL